MIQNGIAIRYPLSVELQVPYETEFPMQPPFSSMGVFLGYCDHSAAIKQTHGGGFNWEKIQYVRDCIRERCEGLSPIAKGINAFEPRFASCFGHSDDILAMLVDSYADAVQVTSGIPQLENYTLAHAFNSDFFPPHIRKIILDPIEWIPQLESSSGQPPLKMITHIKLSGLLTLAFGLHAQLAACTLVAETIFKVIENLSQLKLRQKHNLLFETPRDQTDLFKAFKVSLLAPVGSDDIVLVMHSHNYSLSASALAAIRCLTLGELFRWSQEQQNGLAEICVGNETFFTPTKTPGDCPKQFLSLFAKLAMRQPGEPLAYDSLGLPNRLSQNHMLAASYTTLAVDHDLSQLNSLRDSISGFAAVQANADINPGHEIEAGEAIASLWKRVAQTNKILSMNDYRFVLPGKHDLSLYFNSPQPEGKPGVDNNHVHEQACISLEQFFGFVSELFSLSEDQPRESGFQDISTNLAIPIPRITGNRGESDEEFIKLTRLFQREIDYEEHVNTMRALEAISQGVSSDYLLNQPVAFEQIMLDMELNSSARSAAHRLFSEFADAIGDPIHIDSIVDLSDAFAALYAILEGHSLCKHTRAGNGAGNQLNDHQTRSFLVEAIDGLTQALLLRKGCSSVKREERFGDLQGSITSLLGAGDTAIKSSLGLLRHRLSPDTDAFLDTRKTVTGLIAPVLRERATARQFVANNLVLTLIKMDRMHVFNPAHLVRVLHEVAHLHFDKLVRFDHAVFGSELDNTDTRPLLSKLAAELFAEKITQVVIFGEDLELYVRHQLREFLSVQMDLTTDGKTDTSFNASLLQNVQVLHRFFLVVEFETIYVGELGVEPESHASRFSQFLRRWESEIALPKHCQFADLLNTALAYAEGLAQPVLAIIKVLHKEVQETLSVIAKLERELLPMREIREQVTELVIKKRLPLPIVKLANPVEEGLAVFALIYAQIQATVSMTDTSSTDRQNRFAINANVLKSLWHISTRQKRRRLADILKHAVAL